MNLCWAIKATIEGRWLGEGPDRAILPTYAWLQFEMREGEDGATWLDQTAVFAPRGLMGLLYWYALYPVHAWIFGGMIKTIARRAQKGV